MIERYVLRFDDDIVAEFGTSRSAMQAFRLAKAVLEYACVDMNRHYLVLTKEYRK